MTESEKVSYSELARRVGDCVLNNEIHNNEAHEFELVNGEADYCYVHEDKKECEEHNEDCEYESYDVYQEYIITRGGAEYLQRNTNEIVYYCEELGMYLWGITHFGTGWDCVFTTIGNKQS